MSGKQRSRSVWVVAALLYCGVGIGEARGQGLIIHRGPPVPPSGRHEIREVSIDARVRDQVAEVQVSQVFHNPGSIQIDAEYLFPLPEDGAVQNFVLLVDGQELPGRLMAKDEARKIYEEIVRTKRDPALLEYMGRGLYKTSVFPIPPGADRKVTMRFTQLCKRDREVVEFAYPLSTQRFTAKPIDRLNVTLRIESKDPIKSLYSPSHDVRIERHGDHEARIQFEQRNVVPETDFRLLATLADGALGTTVVSYRPTESEDGYFLLLASPEVKRPDQKPQPKTVVFVLDKSGSMAGKKIEQARNALRFVLDNLREDDTFNIVAYDDRVESFKPELARYSSTSRDEATRYVDNIREGGSTNIDAALRSALEMIPDQNRPSYVIFLTDGLPTAGVTQEPLIASNAKSANKRRARLFIFGVGHDVNARLLDRLSGGNSGTSEYVKPDEDIERSVARFYGKMTSPALAELRVEFDRSDVNRTYPRDLPDLFEGGQLVMVGRYTRTGRDEVRLTGKVGSDRHAFKFPVELAGSDRGTRFDFVEKLWATRRVGHLIDQIDLQGQNKELVDELVALSTRHGILTPYTSFLADDRVPLHARADNNRRAGEELKALNEVSGASAVAQRGAKQRYLQADRAGGIGGMRGGLGGMGGGFGGMGGGLGGTPGGVTTYNGGPSQTRNRPFTQGSATLGLPAASAEGRPSLLAENVRQVGAKTFYRKAERWVDSVLTPEEEAKAIVIKQFSDDYFRLARRQDSEWNKYLAFDEPVTVKLEGQVYRIEPVK